MVAVTLKRLPPNYTSEAMLEATEEAGAVIVANWLSSERVQQLNAELEPWLAGHAGTDSGSAASDDFLGLRTKRLQGLCTKAPTFVEVLQDERLLTYAQGILTSISPTVILNNGEVIDIGPGESAQPLHRDDDAWNFANADQPLMINSITALVDITPEMGATLVVPGSHRWERDRIPTDDEVFQEPLEAGSTLFFRGDTLHAGGANTTQVRRRALSIGICCGWLRPVENSYTNVPVEIARQLPPSVRELLGYALYDASTIGGGYLGYHDMGDPKRLFEE